MIKSKTLLAAVALLIVSSAFGRTFLVSVGITDYSGYPHPISNLRCTANDAKSISKIYAKNSGASLVTLLDRQATKKVILDHISSLFGKAGENDIVVFFFSGHGFEGGICASDGTIDYDELRNAMAKSKSKNKMMFLDACHSGGLRQGKKQSSHIVSSAKKANVMLFLSSRTDEVSIENSTMKNGYFTTFLAKGISGNADANRDRIITAKELFDFVSKRVSNISHNTQHPVMWGNFDDNLPVIIW